MTWVTGVSDNFMVFPLTAYYIGPGWLEAWPPPYVAISGGDATGQDALDGAAVELFEDMGTHAKSFQSPEGEKVLSYPLHDCLGVFGP